MGNLNFKGKLNLMGNLTLKDKVMINGVEALVQQTPPADLAHGQGPPVILPPPPAAPLDLGPDVWVMNSFNQTIKAATKPIVALGMVMQGGKPGPTPIWPGMMQPSVGNPGVTINGLAVNVVGDMCVIFPSGGSVPLTKSGQ